MIAFTKFYNFTLIFIILMGITINPIPINAESNEADNTIHNNKKNDILVNHLDGINSQTVFNQIDLIEPIRRYLQTQSFVSHSPIFIDSNDNFTQLGFPGSGTELDPYLIEGFAFSGTFTDLIEIRDTTAYFKIKNNTIDGMNQFSTGIHLANVVNATIEGNYVFNNTGYGIELESSSNNSITNNSVYDNQGWAGINLRFSHFNKVDNNTVFNINANGISLYNSNDNIVSNNIASFNIYRGIRLEYSSSNKIVNNTLHNNDEDGIWLWYSHINMISNNTAYNNTFIGIRLEYSHDNIITDNTVFDNQGWTGMWLSFSNDNNISNNTAYSNNGNGIDITDADSNLVYNNTAYNNLWNGINFWQNTYSNTIVNNTLISNGMGINLGSNTYSNTIANNTLISNGMGIFTAGSSSNIISNNNATDNNYSLFIRDSPNNIITKNNFVNGGVVITSSVVDDSIQLSVSDNTVNGKPLVYIQSVNGGTVSPDAGQIILINSTGVTVSNQIIRNASIGIYMRFNSDLIITNNTLTNGRYGISVESTDDSYIFNNTYNDNLFEDISLFDSHNNIIIGNYLLSDNDFHGYNFLLGKLHLEQSHFNWVLNNTISNSLDMAIRLVDADNNIIFNNLISDNARYGVIADDLSNNNIIQFNRFIGNNIGGSQVTDNGTSNLFSHNYWSDFVYTDSDNNGIYDLGYAFDGTSNNLDAFPLVLSPAEHYMLPFGFISHIGGDTLANSATISWSESVDVWGDDVTYDFLYSSDAGSTWNVLASDLVATNYSWNTTAHNNGSYVIKVVATNTEGMSVEVILEIVIDNGIETPTDPTDPTDTPTTTPTPTPTESPTIIVDPPLSTTENAFVSVNPILALLGLISIGSLRIKRKRV